jgi:hypothetical protein
MPDLFFLRRGRPTRAGTRSTERIEIVVTCEERKALEQVAKDQCQPLATVVRDAVNTYVADYGEKRVFRAGPFE